ncbi:MAG TPA: proton-conducting transporter membrane subunit [Fimbriiglobus sp.]|nr:proton-conducting transporter membrane subunit [Fimbriiglobus sp.]
MPETDFVVSILVLSVVAAPLALLAVLGAASLVGRPPSEAVTARLCHAATVVGLVASLALLAHMLVSGVRYVPVSLGDWVAVPHFHYSVKFVFDRLSVPFCILTFVLCGTIGAFASQYLHRERGFNRFFVLYAVFLAGMVLTALAGTIETLFAGWELVGLSSALLVAYFHERPAPVRNGLWVWVIYRVSDAALVLAAVVMHRMTGEGDFDQMLGSGPWPHGQAALTESQAYIIGGLLLVAVAGKSALVPFSGWLPRAMEGPTPSSAVFYGALSVHLGVYLLLRVSPILDAAPGLAAAVVVLGLVTAVYGYLCGRVQADIKSALAFASLTQVGIIVAEVGLGLHYLALVHLIGHACLRTLQFLRAPTLMHDYHLLENALGEHRPRPRGLWGRLLPEQGRAWVYRLALERGYLDAILNTYFAGPFVKLFRWFDALERRGTDALAGRSSRESDEVPPHTEQPLDELTV